MIHTKFCGLFGIGSTVGGMVLVGFLLAGCESLSPDPTFTEAQSAATNTSGANLAGAALAANGGTAASTTNPNPTAPTVKPGTVARAANPPVESPVATPTPAQGDKTEIINIGDTLTITFSDLPIGLQPIEQQVRGDGSITLIENQTFTAAGKSRGELEKEIRARYVPRIYTKMTVTIKPLERFFFIGGEVRVPGKQTYTGPITVLKAIQSAGDFTDFAKRTRVRLRRLNGKQETIDCIKARENPALDLPVFPGDTIHVPRRLF